MDSVFNLIFDMFGKVVDWLKLIPVWDNVSLFDFSIVILIMSIVIVAFVNVVPVGSTNYVDETLKAEKAQIKEMERNSYATYKSNRFRKEIYNKRYNEEMGRK